MKNFRPYAKQLNPNEVSKSASKRNLGKEQAPRNFNKHGIIMGMQNAEFSTVNFVIKYEIDEFKKRLRHACEMIAETFRCKFGFSLTQKDFAADNLRELRDRLSVRGTRLLHCGCCVLCMPDCALLCKTVFMEYGSLLPTTILPPHCSDTVLEPPAHYRLSLLPSG